MTTQRYRASDSFGTVFKASLGLIFLVSLFFLLGGRGCQVDDSQAHRALTAAGYHDVRITKRSNWFVFWAGCSNNDAVAWEVSAKNPRDVQVDVLVCAGWPLKGTTVRVK